MGGKKVSALKRCPLYRECTLESRVVGYELEMPVTYELSGVDKAVDWTSKEHRKSIRNCKKKKKKVHKIKFRKSKERLSSVLCPPALDRSFYRQNVIWRKKVSTLDHVRFSLIPL